MAARDTAPVNIEPWLPVAAAAHPGRLALGTPGGNLTYAELEARAQRAAGILARRGARPGDRVGILLAPGAAFAEALHGCLRLGAVAMPLDVRLAPRERPHQAAGARLVIDAPLEGPGDPQAALVERHRADEIAAVVHTSGSAGTPKPIELTYGNWAASAEGSARRLGIDPAERWLCALPVSHVGGLSILIRSAIHATTAVVHPGWESEAVRRALHSEAITLISVVPTTLSRLLDGDRPYAPALRCALVGGGPLPAALAERAADAGVPVAQTYGLTEACSHVTTSEIGEPATAGPPLPGTTVQIDADGEILVSGPTVAPRAVAPDGRLHTGDLGRLDDQGRLLVSGRRADTIVSGGENVAPAEVEAALLEHPAVAEAAVHGRPDPEWGEAVVATVVARKGARPSERELRAHCAELLAAYKVPKAIALRPALPRTPSGKLDRGALG